jgi:hypothetical protein
MSRRSTILMWCLAIFFVVWSMSVQNRILAEVTHINSVMVTMDDTTSRTHSEMMEIRGQMEVIDTKCTQNQDLLRILVRPNGD